MARATSKRVRYKKPGEVVEKKQAYEPPTEGQGVGIVRKCNGGGRFNVDVWLWADERFATYNCSIPGKMKGRNKKKNLLSVGSVVLVNMDMRIDMGEIVLIYTPKNVAKLIEDDFWVDEANPKKKEEEDEIGFDFVEEDEEIDFDKI